ncbi:MAG: AMP-binding protein [Opitutales bacterium]|nr:AMP-binding protein [Opitutales bacterium]
MNIVEALHEVAQKRPDTVGLKVTRTSEDGASSVAEKTFGEMDHEANVWATYFFENNVSRGKTVLLLVPPGEDLLIATFALLRLGAVPIVIDPGMGLKNFFNCVRKTQPNFFLSVPRGRWLCYLLKPFANFENALFLSERLKRKLSKRDFSCAFQTEVRPEDTAAVLFTSGSTGHPKGAVYTYGELNAQTEALTRTFDIRAGEVDFPLLPVFSLYNPAMGLTTVLPEINPSRPSTLEPKKIIPSILKHNVTHSFGSPRLWTKLAMYCEANNVQLPSVKRLFLAGAPIHPTLLKRIQTLVPNGRVFTPYGATEALPVACITAEEVLQDTYQQTLQGCGTCVGHPLPGVRVRIIPITDEPLDTLPNALPTSNIGEITVSAPYVSKRYLNDEVATKNAKIYDTDGILWHRMGDVGYLDKQGRLWFCGRKKERVITAGQTFYTDCCEAIFNAHEKVFRSALIAFNAENQIVPAVVIEPKTYLSKDETQSLFHELRRLAQACPVTEPIKNFCIHKNFPVDVRHNAKIHRLTLMRYFAKHPRDVHSVED